MTSLCKNAQRRGFMQKKLELPLLLPEQIAHLTVGAPLSNSRSRPSARPAMSSEPWNWTFGRPTRNVHARQPSLLAPDFQRDGGHQGSTSRRRRGIYMLILTSALARSAYNVMSAAGSRRRWMPENFLNRIDWQARMQLVARASAGEAESMSHVGIIAVGRRRLSGDG